jgi:HSP20 family protein
MFWPSTRLGRMFDPAREIQQLQRDMNRLFAGVGQNVTYDFPPINVWLSEDDVIVTAELPGVDAAQLDISVVADALTISGQRDPETLKEGEVYHRQERSSGSFARSLKLPFQVEAGKVEARYEKGILEITLPRSEVEKPKKIAIQTA